MLKQIGVSQISGHRVDSVDMAIGHPSNGCIFSASTGQGRIAGFAVRCLSAEMQVVCHTGYELPDAQVKDLQRLQEKYPIERV